MFLENALVMAVLVTASHVFDLNEEARRGCAG
jgi:hypothetical protein